eukprot:767141-Hanusia_phi.AAC.13
MEARSCLQVIWKSHNNLLIYACNPSRIRLLQIGSYVRLFCKIKLLSFVQLPMVVTNPDFVRPDGNDSPMPGKCDSNLSIEACSYVREHVDGAGEAMPSCTACQYTYTKVCWLQLCAARKVIYVGKPHSLVYDQAFERLKEGMQESGDIDKARVCAIGDSILHDIAGAHRTGIDSIFVRLCRNWSSTTEFARRRLQMGFTQISLDCNRAYQDR